MSREQYYKRCASPFIPAVRGVGVGGTPAIEEPILRIVLPDQDPVAIEGYKGAVAVGGRWP